MRSKRHKMLSVVLLLAVLTMNAFAQPKLKLGLQGGVNYADATMDFGEVPSEVQLKKKPRTVFLFGAVAEIGISDMFSVLVEPRYVQKGPTIEASVSLPDSLFGSTQSLDFTTRMKLAYLEVPLSLKATFGSGNFTPYIFAGPNFAYLLSADGEVEFFGAKASQNIKEGIEKFEVGLHVGAGVQYRIAPNMLATADIRYAQGLTKVNKSGTIQPQDNQDVVVVGGDNWKSRDVNFAMGLLFEL